MARQCTCRQSTVMTNGMCICGGKPKPKHTHRPSKLSTGEEVCMDCGKVLIKPILDFDDERYSAQPMGEYPPLPILLVALWESGSNLDPPLDVPPAPYVEDVSAYHRPSNMDEWEHIFEGLAYQV